MSEHGFAGNIIRPPNMLLGKALQTRRSTASWFNSRSIVCYQESSGFDGGISAHALLIDYCRAFDVTTLIWNTRRLAIWNPFSVNTNPDSIVVYDSMRLPYIYEWGFQCASFYGTCMEGGTSNVLIGSGASKSEVFISPSHAPDAGFTIPAGYMIVAFDNQLFKAVAGCSYLFPDTSKDYVIEIPVDSVFSPTPVASGFDGLVGIQYYFGLIGPLFLNPSHLVGNLISPNWYPDLDSFAANIVPGLEFSVIPSAPPLVPPTAPMATAPSWNTGLMCLVPTGPPFA